MKIKVKLEASESTGHQTFDSNDEFGLSDKEWYALSEDEKSKLIQDAVSGLFEQPYWCVDSFDED